MQKRIIAAESAVRDKGLMEGLCCRLRYERNRADNEADREGYEGTQLVWRCWLQIEIMGLEAPKIERNQDDVSVYDT